MNDAAQLIARYLDDRESLSEADYEALLAAVEADPKLAVVLKEQLLLDELLAQRLGLDRQNFLAQVRQRVHDAERGEDDLVKQVAELRALAAKEFDALAAQRRAARQRVLATLAVVLLVAATVGVLYWKYAPQIRTALVGGLGRATLVHYGEGSDVSSQFDLAGGERVETSPQEALTVRYSDGSVIEAGGNTVVEFGVDRATGAKRVLVERGSLAAKVAPQAEGQPMIFATPKAEARVLGTELWLSTRGETTRLDVAEGRVELMRKSDRARVMVEANHFAVATPSDLHVESLRWPSRREGVVFLFETDERANLAESATPGLHRRYRVTPRGAARLDRHFAMRLGRGSFVARGANDHLLTACRRSGELTVEVTLRPENLSQTGPARIVTFASDSDRHNFMLAQQGDALVFGLRTSQTGNDGLQPQHLLCKLLPERTHHVAVTYRPGLLVCYLDGREVHRSDRLGGDFSNWESQRLLFGDAFDGGFDWTGTLEGIAIYDRFLEPEEVAENTAVYQMLRDARPETERWQVLATLVAPTPVPEPADIVPHRAALCVDKYRIDQVLTGGQLDDAAAPGSELFVARWAVLDGRAQAAGEVGRQVRLLLERRAENPQLDEFPTIDSFSGDGSLPRFFLVSD